MVLHDMNDFFFVLVLLGTSTTVHTRLWQPDGTFKPTSVTNSALNM